MKKRSAFLLSVFLCPAFAGEYKEITIDDWTVRQNENISVSIDATNEGVKSSIFVNDYNNDITIRVYEPGSTHGVNCGDPCQVNLQFDNKKTVYFSSSAMQLRSGELVINIKSNGLIEKLIYESKILSVNVDSDDLRDVDLIFNVGQFDVSRHLRRDPLIQKNMNDEVEVSIRSNETVYLDYAADDYNEIDRARIIFVDKDGARDVLLSLGRAIIKEDFLCIHQCMLAIKFDDNPYEKYLAIYDSQHYTARISGYSLTGVGEESRLMIQSNGSLEEKISKSSTMRIRVNFYENYYAGSKESHEYTFNLNKLDINNLILDYHSGL